MLYDKMLLLISSLVMLIGVLVGVAFLVLLERKVLGYIQIRKGPNKLGYMGLMQPFSDAIKLFSKEMMFPILSNYVMYMYAPMLNLFLSLMLWLCIPMYSVLFINNYGVLYFLCISSLSVYSVMIAGWSSNSNYSMLGSLRSVAQTISYEVSMFLILMSFLFLVMSLNWFNFMLYQMYLWFIFIMLPLSMIWVVSSLAETNRTPFDFAEGESELVSGFNVEYSSGGFALIFLAEYSSILFMSMLCVVMFMGANIFSMMFFFKMVFVSFFWIWVRGTLPRYRYDKLMSLAWKSYLSISLNYLFFYMGLKYFIYIILL